MCNEWIGLLDVFDLQLVKNAFCLIIQPLPSHLSTLVTRKKPEELVTFFSIALEFFNHCLNRCDEDDRESFLSCLQMCIDVHKLRIVAFPDDDEYFDESLAYIDNYLVKLPSVGTIWFQKCIFEYTLRPKKITALTELESFIRWYYF